MDLGLGLNMKISRFQSRTLLTLVGLGILFGASCLKKQNLLAEDLGSAVSSQEIANALDAAFGPIVYTDMKVNEMTDIVVSQRVLEGPVQNLQEQNIVIKGINDQPNYLQIQSTTAMTTFSSAGNTTDVRDWDQYFPKYSGFAFSMGQSGSVHQQSDIADLSAPIFMFKLVQSLALASCYDGGTYPETCHNLSVKDVDFHVPAISASQHNCADLYECYIPAKHIEFDLLQKYNLEADGSPRRVHYSLTISQAVPFTSRVLEYCTRALYDVTGASTKVMADVCYKVNKYSFAQ